MTKLQLSIVILCEISAGHSFETEWWRSLVPAFKKYNFAKLFLAKCEEIGANEWRRQRMPVVIVAPLSLCPQQFSHSLVLHSLNNTCSSYSNVSYLSFSILSPFSISLSSPLSVCLFSLCLCDSLGWESRLMMKC